MRRLIDTIITALKALHVNPDSRLHVRLATMLNDSKVLHVQADYPIAVIHTQSRMNDPQNEAKFTAQKLFDDEGFTPLIWAPDMLQYVSKEAPQYLQSVSIMTLDHQPKSLRFINKRAQDYWKKIDDVSHINAMIELSDLRSNTDLCHSEFTLREIIRKRKEVHALKDVGFIWITLSDEESALKKVFDHYFAEHHLSLHVNQMCYHIGWCDKLRDISMRHFVCPPQK